MDNEYINDFIDTVEIYYKELKNEQCNPLTKEEEKELILKAQKGDDKAKNRVITANLRYVFEFAKKYRNTLCSIDDLIAEGNCGMLRAMESFDVSRDVKFYCYAIWWVKFYILKYIKSRNSIKSIEKCEEEISDDFVEKIVDDEEDEYVQKNEQIFPIESEEIKKETESHNNFIIDKLLVSLDDREKLIIEEYYGINGKKEKNLEEIGNELGLTKERVRQIKKKVIYKMRVESLCMNF